MKTIGELLRASEVVKKQYARTVKKDVAALTATLTNKVRIKVCTLPIKGGTIIRYGVSKKGIIEQGRSIRVAKVKLKKQLKQTNK
jgi:hypothetical protein